MLRINSSREYLCYMLIFDTIYNVYMLVNEKFFYALQKCPLYQTIHKIQNETNFE